MPRRILYIWTRKEQIIIRNMKFTIYLRIKTKHHKMCTLERNANTAKYIFLEKITSEYLGFYLTQNLQKHYEKAYRNALTLLIL